MKQKGQGALEYLLLIGGAVVVAAIVVVLLLGLGSTNQGQSEATQMNVMCSQLAASSGAPVKTCTDVSQSAPFAHSYIWNSKKSKCYVCGGTSYPSCTATLVPLATAETSCCLSGLLSPPCNDSDAGHSNETI